MTEKLYEQDPALFCFTARVLSCQKTEKGFETVLDRTAFFPEGGGQAADHGTLADAAVTDVQLCGDTVVHLLDRAVPCGEIEGRLDVPRRLRHMQNHTGEHIVSGLIHRHFGYQNVGFHLGQDVTADFDGRLTKDDLLRIERLANEEVCRNRPVTAWFPSPDELTGLSYRSKDGIEGAVRLVRIGDCDLCACCAPHVKTTGEIGIIKIVDFQKNKGGTRVFLKCGFDALADYNEKQDNIQQIANLFAVKQNETALAADRQARQIAELKYEISLLKKRLITEKILHDIPAGAVTAVFEPGLDGKELQLFSDGLYRQNGGIRGVFSGQDGDFHFAICGEEQALAPFFAHLKAACTVSGGCRNGIRQGTVTATENEIVNAFHTYAPPGAE